MTVTTAILVLLLGGMSSRPALAQMVDTVEMTGQPLVYLRDGAIRGCGLRIIGGSPNGKPHGFRVIDVSVNLWMEGAAIVKGAGYDMAATDSAGQKARQLGVRSVWVKAPGEKSTVPIATGSIQKGDDGVSMLYVSSFESGVDVLMAQVKGLPLMVALRHDDEDGERIYAGKVLCRAKSNRS